MTARLKCYCRTLAIALAMGVLGIGGFVLYAVAHHNLHVVSTGLMYRSAQMNGGALSQVIREYGIKTVVNLRGANPGAEWYQAETNTAQQLGARHFDFSLSASREVTDVEMEKILATIDNSPKPVLIHCKNGADRSGLVGALYLYDLEHSNAEAADQQLTILCGHFPHLFWRDTAAMDRSFWRYASNHVQKPAVDK